MLSEVKKNQGKQKKRKKTWKLSSQKINNSEIIYHVATAIWNIIFIYLSIETINSQETSSDIILKERYICYIENSNILLLENKISF